MIAELLSKDVAVYPIVAMIIFLGVFGVALYWTFRPGSKRIHDHLSQLVLDRKDEVK